MVARVDAATMLGNRVDLRLTLTGFRAPLVLDEMAAYGATVQFQGPLTVGFAEDTALIVTVTFDDASPGLFTLMLDFGEAGQGTVTVIPTVATH